jgi:hypothetical protein
VARPLTCQCLTSLIANFFNGIDPLLTNRGMPDLATSQYSGVANYPRLERAFWMTSSAIGGFGGCQLRHNDVRTLNGRSEPSVE